MQGRAASPTYSSDAAVANGTSGGATAITSTPVLIQRLIILHDGLMPLPPSKTNRRTTQQRRNPQLSEDASLAEHGEFILYYYDHSLHFSQQADRQTSVAAKEYKRRSSNASDTSFWGEKPPGPDHATEEAVRFAGICRALRSLPSALRPEEHDSAPDDEEELPDETDVVHLNDSTLVFTPLELGGDIVSVAQIPRADNQITRRKSDHSSPRSSQLSAKGFGADPSAIREAIRHIHASFSLFFGGGIHRRLLRTKHLESREEWVTEVIEKPTKRSSPSSSRNNSIKVKESSVWEVADDKKVEPEEKDGSSSKKRRKARALKKLSSSFNSFSGDDYQRKRSSTEENSSADYRYGGMEELFNLRREHRKLTNELNEDEDGTPRFGGLVRENSSGRWGSNSNAEDLFNDIANDFGLHDCDRRIQTLLNLLPITKIRKDLVQVYDDWLYRLQGVCEIMRGGAGRCLVEMVPPPICRGLGSSAENPVRGQHPPLSPNAFVCLAASEFMKSLMHEDVPKLKGHDGRLFGMSLLYEDRLVLSQFLPSDKSNHGQGDISPEILYLIAEHFRSSQKEKIDEVTSDEQEGTTQNAPLGRWMSNLSLGAAKNDATEEVKKSTTTRGQDGNPAQAGFLPPPPSSEDESLYVRSMKKRVWLPRVYMPCSLKGYDDKTETYVAMFEGQELAFLLFFSMPIGGGEDGLLAKMADELQPFRKAVNNASQAFADMLTFLAVELSEFCQTYSSRDEADSSYDNMAPIKEINSNSVFPGEPGMDIIYIDRDEGSFVLLSQHDLSSNDFKRIANQGDDDATTNGRKPKFGLFGIGQKPKETTADQTIPCRPSQYSNLLDCRHKLAAYLPLDVMLAFDDMFNEVGRLQRQRNDAENKSIELCTFLTQGWVYARAFCNVELYILLDTSKFVTINDVLKACQRVRERIFNDKIR